MRVSEGETKGEVIIAPEAGAAVGVKVTIACRTWYSDIKRNARGDVVFKKSCADD